MKLKKFLPLIVSAAFFMPAPISAAPMTLSVHDADLRSTIMLVAKTGGLNISIDDSVKGKISISLANVEPLKILEIISKTKSLQLLQEAGVYIVTASSVEVMQSYVFPIKFGSAETLKEAVIMSLDPDVDRLPNSTTRIKNTDGSYTYRYTYRSDDDDSGGDDYAENIKRKDRVFVNPEVNALILFGTPTEYERVKNLLETLDVELKQVSVEAKILAIEKEATKNLGVEWAWSSFNGTYSAESGRSRSYASSSRRSSESSSGYSNESSRGRSSQSGRNHSTSENSLFREGYPDEDENGNRYSYEEGDSTYNGSANQSSGINVFNGSKLNIFNGSSLIQFGRSLTAFAGLNWALSAQINALVTDGKAKILSRPNVMTIQGREALIEIGESVPVLESSITNSTVTNSTEHEFAGIKLKYTPRINSDGTITATIHTEVSTPQYVADMKAYQFYKRSADTTVTVRDGEPMIIGGLIGAEEAKSVSKIPFLGDLPILGALFRNHRKSKTESELVIFLTAHVLGSNSNETLPLEP